MIVVCIGNSFKTKCFPTANSPSGSTTSANLTTPLSPPSPNNSLASSINHCNGNSHNQQQLSSNHHSPVGRSISNRLEAPMTNLIEEDEDEEEKSKEKIDDTDESHAPQIFFADDDDVLVIKAKNNLNNQQQEPSQPQNNNLLINCLNDLKTETCI